MNVFVFFIFASLSASATLDKSGHLMFVEYSINEPTKDEGVIYVDILFHYKGQTYKVARHRYPEPITSIVDTFPWVSKDKWEGGDLEVVAKRADGNVERSYISEQSIEVRDLGYEAPKFEHEVNSALVKIDDGPDPYAWRMLGYDPGHTGYYPFSLYPPLDSLWMYDWSGAGTWTVMISGCAGHDMLFIPLAPWGWNRIAAFDMENGDTIWQRVLTSNVWTSALSLDDSTLFVGTSIGFTPWKDTTFYALDPFTGKFKWGKSLKTVEYSPIIVDTFVYAPHFYKVYCFSYSGDSIWAANGAYSSPVYEDGIIVGASTDSVLNARDYLTGKLIWDFTRGGWIYFLMSYQDKVIFSPSSGPLYALNVANGMVVWTNWDYPLSDFKPAQAHFETIFIENGYFANDTIIHSNLNFIDSKNGNTIWDSLFLPLTGYRGGAVARLLITADSLLWYAKTDAVYLLRIDDHSIIFFMPFPKSPALFPSCNFPIFYKNYFIYAHEDFLVTYRADTIFRDTIVDSLPSHFNLEVSGNITGGRLNVKVSLPENSKVTFKIFDISGRKIAKLLEGNLRAGCNQLSFNLSHFPAGIYFIEAEIRSGGDMKIARKFLILK